MVILASPNTVAHSLKLIIDTPERTDAMRNDGSSPTPQKREMLARIDARAHDAGVEPLKAYF